MFHLLHVHFLKHSHLSKVKIKRDICCICGSSFLVPLLCSLTKNGLLHNSFSRKVHSHMENLPSSLFLLQQPMNVSNHIQSNDYVVTLISFFFFLLIWNYTLYRKYNKCSSLFDIYLTKWGKNEKYEFYIY